ncbi:ataxin-1-like, partial [Pollicipes pollicipes]|uniref:ataxin-1-like n=1 Tax=Pollicipes pollicipes TaxID=41117 RepID=UPI001884ED39
MPAAVASEQYAPPEYFRLGSIIELADGRQKRVEELQTEDFETSADLSAELRLDRSVVTRIEQLGRTAYIVFAVGPYRTEVALEAQLEHPFFVFHRGWSSCSPALTLQLYSLPCRQLEAGDACV